MFKFSLTLLIFFTCLSSLQAEKNGKEAYKLSCVQCHGEDGAGGTKFLEGPNLTILKDEYFKEQFKAILQGNRKGPGTVNMLKILKESKLSDKEIQAAADYAMKLPRAGARHLKFGDIKNGKAKYNTLCIHCHGANGEGYTNPALPAPRLAGQADFYIVDQIKAFKAGHRDTGTAANQQMKAMSAALTTEKDIKDVAAYIRTLDDFKPADLNQLTFKVYQGTWKKMPDFSKLKPTKEGSVSDGVMDIRVAELKDHYAIVFEGKLRVPKDGKYKFSVGSDDGSKLYIDGKLVVNNDGIHAVNKIVTKSAKLNAGTVSLKVEYFEASGQEGLNISWNGPGIKNKALTPSSPKGGSGKNVTPIPIEPNKTAGEALLFRNFIKDASARSIAVGYPEGTHIVFDATNMNLALMWKGQFLDAGAMWKGRGTSFMEPQGTTVKIDNNPQVGILTNSESKFPDLSRKDNKIRQSNLRFRGYTLDKKRYPTFQYSLNEISFEDFFKPIDTNGTGIVRKVTAKASNGENLWFRVAVNNIVEDNGTYVIGGKFKVIAANAKLRSFGKIHELLIPFQFSDGKAVIEIKYLFAGE